MGPSTSTADETALVFCKMPTLAFHNYFALAAA